MEEDIRRDVGRILVSEEEIRRRVRELGEAITSDYAGRRVGDELLVVGILKGAVMFLADLAREIRVPLTFDFMAVSSYGRGTQHSGVVRILKDLEHDIEGRDVLVVEDIVDTGLTLQYLLETLQLRRPRSLRTAVLLDKPERRLVDVPVHYRGFVIPDEFVVGYGIDWNERYRNLRYVAALRREAYEPPAGPGGGAR